VASALSGASTDAPSIKRPYTKGENPLFAQHCNTGTHE
jgi:hypothetical protein